MEFLDTMYDDNKKPEEEKVDNTSLTLGIVDQALKIEGQIELKDFIAGLDENQKGLFTEIRKAKTTAIEKALVTALLAKYPKVMEDDKAKDEFRAHIQNMKEVNQLSNGALKHLLGIMVTKTEEGKLPKVEEDPNNNTQPEPENSENQEAGQEGAVQTAEDSENSGQDDFYDSWSREFNDTHTDMTEDEFADLVVDAVMPTEEVNESGDDDLKRGRSASNQRTTSENVKKTEGKGHAYAFLKAMKKDMAGNDAYTEDEEVYDDSFSSIDVEDFIADRVYMEYKEEADKSATLHTKKSDGSMPGTHVGTSSNQKNTENISASKLQDALMNHVSIYKNHSKKDEEPLLPGYLSSESSVKNFKSEAVAIQSKPYISTPERERLSKLLKRIKAAKKLKN